MTVANDDREEGGVCARVMLAHLVRHVFEGTVCEGALAQVVDAVKAPDEVGLGGERAEKLLSLGVVQAANRPCDPGLAPVVLLVEPLDKHLCEFPDAFEQLTWGGLLQRDGF